MPQNTLFCLEIFFSGHVQGVGFRYHTSQIAKGFDVTGRVRNLPDGRVHLITQGEKEEVEAFIETLKDEMSDFIKSCDKKETPGNPELKGFEITF